MKQPYFTSGAIRRVSMAVFVLVRGGSGVSVLIKPAITYSQVAPIFLASNYLNAADGL